MLFPDSRADGPPRRHAAAGRTPYPTEEAMKSCTRFAAIQIVVLAALPGAWAAMQRTGSTGDAKLRGAWYPAKTAEKLPGSGWKLEVSDHHVAVSHTRGGLPRAPF